MRAIGVVCSGLVGFAADDSGKGAAAVAERDRVPNDREGYRRRDRHGAM
jgi:hypothetical protein